MPCDLARVEFSRTHWPFLRDRRIDAYGDLTRRFVGSRLTADCAVAPTHPHADAPRLAAPTRRSPSATRSPPSGRPTAARGCRGRGPRASRSPTGTTRSRPPSRASSARSRAARRCTSTSPTATTSASSARRCAPHGVRSRRVFFHQIPTNECWCRDHGPAFVLRRRAAGRLAGGGGRLGLQRVGRQVPAVGRRRRGADAGGAGARAAGVRTRDRDGGRRRRLQRRGHRADHHVVPAEPEPQPGPVASATSSGRCTSYYGQRHVVWLGDGIAGDDTDGHVDDLARFVGRAHGRHRDGGRPVGRELPGAAREPAAARARARPGRPRPSRSSSCRCPARSSTTGSGCRPPT